MVVEEQFWRECAYAQHGNYLRHQVVWSQPVMDKLAQFPMNCWNNNGILPCAAYRGQWKLREGRSTHVTSVSSKAIGNINPKSVFCSSIDPRFVSGNPCYTANFVPKVRQEVYAFGPKHAERAQRFYQETLRSQPVLVPPRRPTYDLRVSKNKLSQVNRGEYLLEQPTFGGTLNHRTCYNHSAIRRVPVSGASHPRETVLKVAMISSRPKVKRQDEPKAERAFGEKIHRKRLENESIKKSVDFKGKKNILRELSEAPLFQILCEISSTN